MKTREFDALTRKLLSPLLETEQGFSFGQGGYWRNSPNQVRHLVLLDFDVDTGRAFRVMVGLNSELLCPGIHPVSAGLLALRFVGHRQLSRNAKTFPCHTRDSAEAGLSEVAQVLRSDALPWFAEHDSLAALAEVAEPEYEGQKAKLFFLAGECARARPHLERHLEYLRGLPADDEILEGLRETRAMLEAC